MVTSAPRLIAIDPSLTCTGWVVFDVESQRPTYCSVFRPPGTEVALSERYDWLQSEVMRAFDQQALGPGDFLVCEGPAPLVKNPESALRVERVRSIFEAVGRLNGVKVLQRLNPRTVQTEILGLRGKQLARDQVKSIARSTVLQVFPEFTNDKKLSQDVVDALLIGMLAVSKVQIHVRTGMSLELLFQTRNSSRSSWRMRASR